MNAFFDPDNKDFAVDDFGLDQETIPAPSPSPSPIPPCNRWSPQLIFDLALGLDDYETIGSRYGITAEYLERLYELPVFRQEVALLTRELREKNEIFKHKSKVLAETYLDEMAALMLDRETAAGTKLSIFQTLAKYGELEPKEKPQTYGPNLNPGQAMRMVVEWVGGPKDHSPLVAQNAKMVELNS